RSASPSFLYRPCLPQILDQLLIGLLALVVIDHAQQRRGMTRHDDGIVVRRPQPLPATLQHTRLRTDDGEQRGGAEADDDPRLDDLAFRVEPGMAGARLTDGRLLVNAPLAALLELEVLDRVGDVDARAIDAGIRERAIEQLPSRADERPALPI